MSGVVVRSALGMPGRVLHGRPRFVAGVACGIVAVTLLPHSLAPNTRGVLAWDAGSIVFLLLTALMFAREHQSRMQEDAARQQEGEWTVFFLTVAGIIFSFIAIIGEFSGSKDFAGHIKALHVALVATTLFLSWLVTQTVFAMRYAHEYYTATPGIAAAGQVDAGLEFPGEPAPDYLDFMYFALVLGMTFQVSDVQITSRKLRRLAALHGLLGFVFNTVIIALTVNIASGLL